MVIFAGVLSRDVFQQTENVAACETGSYPNGSSVEIHIPEN